jgi:HPt (histidine-containing phosphotransfer) domain-containing protein
MNGVFPLVKSPASGSVLDREVALSRVGGDAELLKEIAVLFLENYQAWLGELRDAAVRGDAKVVENTAHGLKGSVSNFGAQAAVEAALQLETLGRNRDLTGVSVSLAALESALEALRPELESL